MGRSKLKIIMIILLTAILSFPQTAAYSEAEDVSVGEVQESTVDKGQNDTLIENSSITEDLYDTKDEGVEKLSEPSNISEVIEEYQDISNDEEAENQDHINESSKDKSNESIFEKVNSAAKEFVEGKEEDTEINDETSELSAISELGHGAIEIDGYFDDWDDKPYSWEYNWNNNYFQEYYWDAEQNKNITKYWLDENGRPYNLQIRHRMSLYCDGVYVYLHIKISDQYWSRFNGEDYQFHVDGKMAAFQVEFIGGGTITNNTWRLKQGRNEVEVRHRDSALSYKVVKGAKAYLFKTSNDVNDELELKIPLSALKEQNPSIDIKSFNKIEFFTPNLMYRKLTHAGTSTAPYAGILLGAGAAGIGLWKSRRKLKKEEK